MLLNLKTSVMARKTDYDLCIIGGGAAGLVAAAGAATLGAKVMLIFDTPIEIQ